MCLHLDNALQFTRYKAATFLAAICACLSFGLVHAAAERWETLPPTPPPVAGETTGHAAVDGIQLFYATIGKGPPVLLLHGGLANSDYLGGQAKALMPHHMVILVDSRGHGRSSHDARPYGYDLMADEFVALLDRLKIPHADVVGWSDGAIIGLDLALRYPNRVNRVVAFAANVDPSGTKPGAETNPTVGRFFERAAGEYAEHSPTPKEFDAFVGGVTHMWATQPNWNASDLKRIKTPVLVVDGDHDELIKSDHTQYIASTIPGARLAILSNTGHFAFLQDPETFNTTVLQFLGDR